MFLYWLLIVLTKSPSSVSLNVTVSPGPAVVCVEGESVSLVCVAGGRRRGASVVVLRWVVRPQQSEDDDGGGEEDEEFLLVKLNVRGTEFWGNYTQRSDTSHFQLHHDNPGYAYSLLLSNVTRADRGRYSCRVQEVRKHRNRWRALANGTAHTLLRVNHVVLPNRVDCIWRLFQDLYLCAAVLCSIGLVSMFLFAIVIAWQQLTRRPHPKGDPTRPIAMPLPLTTTPLINTLSLCPSPLHTYTLVKCPDSSSGETVTTVTSVASEASRGSIGGSAEGIKGGMNGGSRNLVIPVGSVSSARPHRKQKRHKHHPPDPHDAPPLVPAKAPRIQKPQKPRRTKLLKAQPRRTAVVDDSLTYAELELVKAKPEPTAEPTASSSGTVYAQILFT
ncbi:V-set and transmembrane domain-containing protein 4a [Clupea harengus]|uniref:V-set and transmembrane domain-containing protein 4a n=1 Tax=Clupea harengus TaxID=7950 RepID=A0A8M1KSC1_CLUHA|nr:V-set and transmembrane domain-containing protein 4a [Clupea harengus]